MEQEEDSSMKESISPQYDIKHFQEAIENSMKSLLEEQALKG
jgi:hypothetical protein